MGGGATHTADMDGGASGAHAADMDGGASEASGAHAADMDGRASEASGANASGASEAHNKAPVISPLRALLALARARKRGQEDTMSAEDKKQACAQKEKQARLLLARKRGRPVGSKNKKSSGRDMAAGMEGGASEASGAHPAGMEGRVSGVRKRGPPVGSKHSKPRKKAHGGDIYLRLLAAMESGASEASGARPVEADAVLLVDRFLAEEHYALQNKYSPQP